MMKKYFEGKRVLITGGLGFIGSNLAIRLEQIGADITIVDSLLPNYGGNLENIKSIKNKIKINISDVRDQYSLKYLVKDQDYLFNLAGQTSHLDSMNNPYEDLDINCRAQLSILDTCKEFNPEIKIIFASTRQIYGKPDYLPVDEQHPIRPVDINGINKLSGEWYHRIYNKVHGLKSSILRLTNTYGPRMRIKDTRQTFLGIWIRLLMEDKPIEVWGGEQLRDFNYIDDCIDALINIAISEKSNGQVYNLGSHEYINLIDLANLMVSLNGSGETIIRPFPKERKKIDIGDYYSDYSRIKKDISWEPKISLHDGIKKTLAYYKNYFKKYI